VNDNANYLVGYTPCRLLGVHYCNRPNLKPCLL